MNQMVKRRDGLFGTGIDQRFGQPNYLRAISQTDAILGFIDIDLTIARTDVKVEGIFGGDYVYAPPDAFDSDEVVSATRRAGFCFLKPNNKDRQGIYVRAGDALEIGVFNELFITNQAQSNAMIRLYFSAGPAIIPSNRGTSLLTGVDISNLGFVDDGNLTNLYSSIVHDTDFFNTVGAKTILAPAANVNGAVLLGQQVWLDQSATQGCAFGHGSAAPVSSTDMGRFNFVFGQDVGVSIETPISLEAGQGLFYFLFTTAGVPSCSTSTWIGLL